MNKKLEPMLEKLTSEELSEFNNEKNPRCAAQALANCYVKCFEPGRLARLTREIADWLTTKELIYLSTFPDAPSVRLSV